MYADTVTDSMREAIEETGRRRAIQMKFNEEHGIEPQTVRKAINDISSFIAEAQENVGSKEREDGVFFSPAAGAADDGVTAGAKLAEELSELPHDELQRMVATMEEDMRAASEAMDFEEAARLRDVLVHLKATLEGTSEDDVIAALRAGSRKGSVFGGGRKRTGARFGK